VRPLRFYVDTVRSERRPLRFLISRLLWRSGLCRFVTIRQDGYRIRFHPSSIPAQLWVDPRDRAETPAFFRAYLRVGDVVVDVGSNVGTTVLAAAAAVGDTGRVYAIEPHPRIFGFLVQNLELNSIETVRAYNVAIGADEGVIRLSDRFPSDDENRVVTSGGVEVPLRRLDDLVDEPVVHLLKIDVEGYELRVLAGAQRLLTRSRCVYLESREEAYRSYGYGTQDVLDVLRETGFEVFSESAGEGLRRLPDRYASTRNENLVAVREPAHLTSRLRLALTD
jgi:FkbM family methyltransferase